MTDVPNSKRPRLSLPVALSQQQQQLDNYPHAGQEDIINFFAKRGSRLREMEDEQAENSSTIAKLKEVSENLRIKVASVKESARLQAQEDEARKAMYRQEQAEAEELFQKEVGKNAELMERLKEAENGQADRKAQAQKAEAKLAEIRGSFRQEQLTVMAKIQRLETDLRNARLDAQMAKSKSRISGPIYEPIQETEPFRELQQQKDEVEARLEEESHKRRALEADLVAQQRRAEQAEAAVRQAQGVTSNEEVVRALRTELRSQEAAIKDSRKMRDRIKSIEILQEKLQSAEARAARAEQGHSNELELQSRVSSLEIQLQAWETHANGVGVDGPQELADKLRELQTEYLAAGDRLSEREVELRKLTESLKSAEIQKAEAEAALHSVQGSLAETTASAARLERRVMLLTKERDGMNRILASYDADAIDKSVAGDAKSMTILAAKVEEAEGKTKTLEQQMESLEEDALKAAGAIKKVELELADTLAKVISHEAENEALRRQAEFLEDQISTLQGRLDKGEFNSATTRVLHCVINPEAEARKEHQASLVAELEAEVAVLKMQNSLASKPDGDSGGDPQPHSAALAALEAEAVVAKQKIAELTKKETRLKDVFQQQVANFREAVFCLFGYRVDMAAEAQAQGSTKKAATTFVLKPQHAENGRMQLVFQFRGGRMELLPTDFTNRKLKREVETFVERFKSIPAFTANWTMELFQKQTHA